MIAWLSGKVKTKSPGSAVIETGGVGYLVHVPLPTFYALPGPGDVASLYIHTNVKEDAIQLYGFATKLEQEVFTKLIGVNKVGPKLAITILSGMEAAELIETVRRNDLARLSAIPGIGKKTAERLVVELSDKFAGIDTGYDPDEGVASTSKEADDAIEALISLGYKRHEAQKAVGTAMTESPGAGIEDIIKSALANLA